MNQIYMDIILSLEDKMGVIYKITNLINGKIYIGQTVVTEPQRWQNHVWHAYNDPKNDAVYLCNAIKKYGKENFKREIIDEADTRDELNNKEIQYILLYNSTDPSIGYNIANGGEGREKYNIKRILELYNQYHSIAKVALILGSARDTISKRLRGIGINTYNKTINQYSLEEKLIDTYSSFAEAKRVTGLPLPHIVPSHHFSCGYIWIYDEDDLDVEKVINNYKQNNHLVKSIQQYDLNCQLINLPFI